jgi:hypothetical protein
MISYGALQKTADVIQHAKNLYQIQLFDIHFTVLTPEKMICFFVFYMAYQVSTRFVCWYVESTRQ